MCHKLARMKEIPKYDVIIIGAGVAGLSAALWCDELNLSCSVSERGKRSGGQLHWIHNPIKNHLGGIEARNGREMYEAMSKQLSNRKFEIIFDANINEVDLQTKRVTLADYGLIEGRNIVIATGLYRRQLNVKGESEFRGRGVYDSGTGDKDLIKGKRAVVVGGGDAAAENALLLSEVCPRVTLIHRRETLRARPEFLERIKGTTNIEVLLNTTVTEICGAGKTANQTVNREASDVQNVRIKTQHKGTQIDAEAVVVRIGYQPNTEDFENQLALDEHGYIKVNSQHETGIENIFAIGDVSNPLAPTISGAIGAGATVAKVIEARKRIVNRKS